MTRYALLFIVALAAIAGTAGAEAKDACIQPIVANGKPAALRAEAEKLAISAWDARLGTGSPFAWDSPHTQRKALKCVSTGGRFTCEAVAVPCTPGAYEACQGAFVNDGPDGRDYCGSGTADNVRVWQVTCGPGYRLKARAGPDLCELDPRWSRK